jgi:hypothetical protein
MDETPKRSAAAVCCNVPWRVNKYPIAEKRETRSVRGLPRESATLNKYLIAEKRETRSVRGLPRESAAPNKYLIAEKRETRRVRGLPPQHDVSRITDGRF